MRQQSLTDGFECSEMEMILRLIVILFVGIVLSSCGGGDSGGADESPIGESDEITEELKTDFNNVVFIGRGTIQCETTGTPLSESEQTLVDAGIDVIWSSCGGRTDGGTMAVCGAPSSALNFHKVHAQNVEDAEALGFAPATNEVIPESGKPLYKLSSCPPSLDDE